MLINHIEKKILDEHGSIQRAIEAKELYLRISVIGTCNFTCLYCHNEGGNTGEKLTVLGIKEILKTAHSIGYSRVHFTGGEPLLHNEICDFISLAREFYDDVGITTNGSLLPAKLNSIINAGTSRLHISIVPVFSKMDTINQYLSALITSAKSKNVAIRLNLPLDSFELEKSKYLLKSIAAFPCEILIQPIFRTDQTIPLKILEERLFNISTFLEEENNKGALTNVAIRSYRKPKGMRCSECPSNGICLEYSRSLRLGADYVFRPCLAERKWDCKVDSDDLENQIIYCTLLALDY